MYGKYENTQGITIHISRKYKDRQYNGKRKRTLKDLQNIKHKTND
jgi:hypothetical protein